MSSASMPVPSPQDQLVMMALGFAMPCMLRVAAQLSLADQLADGPKSAEELAAATSTHAHSLYRLLRTLACHGIFIEDDAKHFANTPLSEPLRSNIPGSVRSTILTFTGEIGLGAWWKLLYSVQTGKPSFDLQFGLPIFDYLTANPDQASMFTETMIGIHGPETPAVAAAYDFKAFAHIADIGGASGKLLTSALASAPDSRGTLFDLPHNEANALAFVAAKGMSDRVEFVGGSFFESVPAGADLYMMSHIIHDWTEEQCLTILANCHRAMPDHARLLIIEMVLAEGNAFHFGKVSDIMMLAVPGGEERTESQYAELLAKANFKLTRVIPTDSNMSIVEAVKA